MSSSAKSLPLEQLLEHADWVKGLAHRLVSDAARAEDLVQETWLRALERPPRHAGNVRAWLGRVMTNVARSGGRSQARRARRERDAAVPDAQPPTDELVAEATQSRELVDTLLGLDEPYRTVLLLRYFRDMSPARIARELDRPVATVKTQLQRGLARMRERLDERYGDRRAWCLALLPLARAGVPAVGLSAKLAAPAAALALVALTGWGAARLLAPEDVAPVRLSRASSPVAAQERLVESPLPQPPASSRRASSAEAVEPAREAVASTSEPAAPERTGTLLRGRLVDLEGRGIPGVELEWIDPGALRWADEARTVISGRDTWVRVTAETRRALREDPDERERFARARFRRPELAVALLSAEPPPRHLTRTGPRGAFELQVPEPGYELQADGGWSVLGRSRLRGEDVEAWFAVRPRTVVGRVLDARGEPVADVEVVAHGLYPEEVTSLLELGRGFSSSGSTARTDSEGRFRMDEAGLSARFALAVDRGNGESVWERVEIVDEPRFQERVEVELRLSPPAPPPLRVRGRVLLPDGSPAARATVVLGEASAVTGDDGEYLLELRTWAGDLYAARAGLGIAVAPSPGADWERSESEVRGPDLRLAARSLALEGRVVDRAGRPVAAELLLARGDIVDLPERSYGLEDLAAGRTPGVVLTDAAGRFRVDGLLPRDYGLLVRHAGEDRPSPARYAAGSVGIELVVDG